MSGSSSTIRMCALRGMTSRSSDRIAKKGYQKDGRCGDSERTKTWKMRWSYRSKGGRLQPCRARLGGAHRNGSDSPKLLAVFALDICPSQSDIAQHLVIERGQMPASARDLAPKQDRLNRPAEKASRPHRYGRAMLKRFGCSRCHDQSPVHDGRGAVATLATALSRRDDRTSRLMYPADFATTEFVFQSFPPAASEGRKSRGDHFLAATIETYLVAGGSDVETRLVILSGSEYCRRLQLSKSDERPCAEELGRGMRHRLSLAHRLLLIYLLSFVSVAVLAFSLIAEENIAIEFAKKEQRGSAFLAVARDSLLAIVQDD